MSRRNSISSKSVGRCAQAAPQTVIMDPHHLCLDLVPDGARMGVGRGPVQTGFWISALSQSNSSTYSGDLNAPFAGVSFLAACNSHDACWGSAMHRGTCDIQFRGAMESACSGQSNPDSYNVCMGYAGMYHGAVSTTNGSNEAYAKAVSENSCAAWVHDMKANGCAP
jgi:hypothetical protein